MENRQVPTYADVADEDKTLDVRMLKVQHQQWVDFTALGGLMTDDNGEIKKLTIQQFATAIGVNRDTLYEWKRLIPNFYDLVAQRRKELFKQNRANNVINRLYLEAIKGEGWAVKFYHEAYLDYQPPAQKHEINVTGGVADLLELARERRRQLDNVQEGEVIDAKPTDN